jgi:hypothetical protein
VNAVEKRVIFDPTSGQEETAFNSKELLQNMLGYARELERIV